MARVLVVEDDMTIGAVLRSSLGDHGYSVDWVTTGAAAIRAASGQVLDLVLLDLGLPDLDGVDVCRRLRVLQPGCVLVVLTARVEEIDVVVGLEAGADDYLTKPFRLAELLARVRAHLRRGGAGAGASAPSVIRLGELEIDTLGRRVRLGGTEIALRAKEFDLLERLARDPDTALSRAVLMAEVWDENWFGSTKTLDVHVSALRRKLSAAGGQSGARAPEIVTLRAHGYRLQTGRESRDSVGT